MKTKKSKQIKRVLLLSLSLITLSLLNTSAQIQDNFLIGTGFRLLQTDNGGNIIPFLGGTSNQVLLGNGTWGTAPSGSQWLNNGSSIYYNGGSVGIGVNNPMCELHVKSSNGNVDMCLESSNGGKWDLASDQAGNFGIYQPSTQLTRFQINSNGQARIGTKSILSGPHANYKLAVDGKIVAKEMYVTLDNWADFVFNKNYKLRPLAEVEHFIACNKHLPDVPTEIDIKENGNDLGKTDAILLRKIEELTLYVIQQQKEISEQQKQIEELKNKFKN